MMDLQPYGPIEEAIQKSTIPETQTSNTKHFFFWGAVAVLLTGMGVYWYMKKKHSKTPKKQTN